MRFHESVDAASPSGCLLSMISVTGGPMVRLLYK